MILYFDQPRTYARHFDFATVFTATNSESMVRQANWVPLVQTLVVVLNATPTQVAMLQNMAFYTDQITSSIQDLSKHARVGSCAALFVCTDGGPRCSYSLTFL
jgi:hypothetical protein